MKVGFVIDTTKSELMGVGSKPNYVKTARYEINRRYFSIKDLIIVFNGWARSLLHCNSLAFLPFLTHNLIEEVQRATNGGLRAIHVLYRYDKENIIDLRKSV